MVLDENKEQRGCGMQLCNQEALEKTCGMKYKLKLDMDKVSRNRSFQHDQISIFNTFFFFFNSLYISKNVS